MLSLLYQIKNSLSERVIMTKTVEKHEGVILPHISSVSDTKWLHIKNYNMSLLNMDL